ncbi:MAG: chorismate synthase, partial [Thermoplasmata archaeon]
MMQFGRTFQLTLFGASHAPSVGIRLQGVPAGTPVDLDRVQAALDRRRPFGRALASRRQEEDRLIIDDGIVDGRADGRAIQAHVANTDARPSDYDGLATTPRPGHADYPARVRYGRSADLSGGGIFSGRMTVGLVLGGAIAAQLLGARGIDCVAYTRSIGTVDHVPDPTVPLDQLRQEVRSNEVGCPDPAAAERMADEIRAARRAGDSVGGVIEVRAEGLPVGLGEPFFDSVESVLAHLAFSVPAVKAVEFGAGAAAARMKGSDHNDPYFMVGDEVRTRTNHAGGILGGLANGMPLLWRVAVKPTSSIARAQET